MSHNFTSRLRRFGAGTAAILLIAGAAACGGGSESAERGDGKMKSMLGGGNDSRDRSGERSTDERRNGERGNGERSGGENGGSTVRMGSDSERAGADNFDRRVRIVNNSGQTISFLRGSPTSDQNWGADRIPTLTLSAGQSTIVDFNDNNGECRYDLQAQFADGSTREQRDVNICQVSEWIVTDDGSSAR
ncbi:hypothetical protein [Sphingosinicella sp. YJ22]|uniref:hypothetical protein n=1 Tax=Sphingosinicella sp. YJ22 TaxID=1104780 RepID=UPI00140D05E3|nr:hypothetical protein [Sphingosinicella sp. YJ22]